MSVILNITKTVAKIMITDNNYYSSYKNVRLSYALNLADVTNSIRSTPRSVAIIYVNKINQNEDVVDARFPGHLLCLNFSRSDNVSAHSIHHQIRHKLSV